MIRELRCRVCGVRATFVVAFEKRGFRNHLMRYERCGACGSLLCTDPTWLDAAYAQADDANDGGAPARADAVARTIRALGQHARWLDYGAGRGLLAERLHGTAVVSYDPFRAGIQQLTHGPFDGASMVEVLEHLMEPEKSLAEIHTRLGPSMPLVLTTNLYEPSFGPSWSYLASELGQHVTFPSLLGLRDLAKNTGFSYALSLRPHELYALEIHLLFKQPCPEDVIRRLSETLRRDGSCVVQFP